MNSSSQVWNQLDAIDWDDVWRRQLQAASFRTLGDRWNQSAATWDRSTSGTAGSNYVDEMIARMRLSPLRGTRMFRDLDEAVAQCARARTLDQNMKGKLKAFLAKELPYRDGCYCRDMGSPYALISWEKNGVGRRRPQ